MTALARPAVAADIRPLLFRLGLALLLAVLLWHVGDLLAYARTVFSYPFQIDFGEGIVWQQMRDMLAGTAYAPLRTWPAVVYHYPPVYHLTAAGLSAALGLDQLLAGRIVSFVATIATAILAGMLAWRAAPDRDRTALAAAVLAGLLFLNCYPVIIWAPLMRVDMLTGALGLAGMVLALRALDRPALIHAAALLFTLSVFTKQISLAAPIATFAVLLFIAPRLAVRGILSGLAMALAALGLLVWLTNGGFLTHVVAYNVNRLAPEILVTILLPHLLQHAALVLLATIGGASCWRTLRRDGVKRQPAVAMILLFAALKTVMLVGILKSGSNYNYLIEWFSAIAILAAIGLYPAIHLAMQPADAPAGAGWPATLVLLGALIVQMVTMPIDLPNHAQAARVAAGHMPLVARIAASPRPVISDEMAFVIRAGKKVEFESAITAELGAAGMWDQPGFVAMIRARCFGFFVTDGRAGEYMFGRRYNPPVAAAIAAAYPRIDHSGKFVIHLPADASSDCKTAF